MNSKSHTSEKIIVNADETQKFANLYVVMSLDITFLNKFYKTLLQNQVIISVKFFVGQTPFSTPLVCCLCLCLIIVW